MASRVVVLTTPDNPFDPINQFDLWYDFDLDKERRSIDDNGNRTYLNCCSYLDRMAKTSPQLSEFENVDEIERAIDEIIKYDVTNTYMKVVREV